MKLPEGHQTVMPYLILSQADQFRDFVTEVFGGTETARYPNESGGVMHAEASIGGATLMYADATGEWPPQTSNLYIYVENLDEVYAKALSAGATTAMPPERKDYGYTCGVVDPTGNTWWITQA